MGFSETKFPPKNIFNKDLSLPLGSKEHRLQLLRSWLLYFTTTVHGYFMSRCIFPSPSGKTGTTYLPFYRVVHSTEVELRSKLSKATDLDMILEVITDEPIALNFSNVDDFP